MVTTYTIDKTVKTLLILVFAVVLSSSVFAVNPDEVLKDNALELRAREVSKSVRCLVCQNQSIDDSNADLAKELRTIVRERIVLGDSNKQVMQFLTIRYGDYVLLEPPFRIRTLLLWAIPIIILILGFFICLKFLRKRNSSVIPLSSTEKSTIDALLKGKK